MLVSSALLSRRISSTWLNQGVASQLDSYLFDMFVQIRHCFTHLLTCRPKLCMVYICLTRRHSVIEVCQPSRQCVAWNCMMMLWDDVIFGFEVCCCFHLGRCGVLRNFVQCCLSARTFNWLDCFDHALRPVQHAAFWHLVSIGWWDGVRFWWHDCGVW